MKFRQSRIPTWLAVVAGAITSWTLTVVSTTPIRANGGDRSKDVIVATGPVLISFDEGIKAPISLDAVYVLDYSAGTLLATVPSSGQVGAKARMLDKFYERDLAVDFDLDRHGVDKPKFLMTTGALGAYQFGWAPLYVFETTSRQVAVYHMQVAQLIGTSKVTKFELVEITSYAKNASRAVQQP